MENRNEVLADSMVGVWWLRSRLDFGEDGSGRVEPSLGSDPLGILTYTRDRFAAQFMKRDRSGTSDSVGVVAGENNTAAIGGYDAYFGTYEVDRKPGRVLHKLEGALTPSNVGLEVFRNLSVKGDQLEIWLETTTEGGEAVTRVLTWDRVG